MFLGIITALPVHADGTHPKGVRLDGTVGNAGQLRLSGPDYDIRADHGQQAGPNLFHSFRQFNIHSGESATFTGPNSVQNIISRVTDGNTSWIDGRLGSTIPGADLYLLNPAGVMFGANASLDLSGSFHVSTADYLRLGENEHFDAMPQQNGVLSVATPTAFGFLDNDVAPISVEGRGEISEEEWKNNRTGLHVSEERTISLIGGDVEMKNGTYYAIPKVDENGNPTWKTQVKWDKDKGWHDVTVYDDDGNPVPGTETIRPGDIKAPGGRINIAGVAGAGEVTLLKDDLKLSAPSGDVRLHDTWISTTDEGAGDIYIRAGRFELHDSMVMADTNGTRDGGNVDIRVNELTLAKGSGLTSYAKGSGQGGRVRINAAGSVEIAGENADGRKSGIFARSLSEKADAGDSGDIVIQAERLSLKDGAGVSANTQGPGQSGNIAIRVADSISLSGQASVGIGSFITCNSDFDYTSDVKDAGTGGTIELEAKNLSLSDGARIRAATWGRGDGGNIRIKATDSVRLSGECIVPESNGHVSSFISLNAEGQQEVAGDGGNLELEAGRLELEDGAWIGTTTSGVGQGGNMDIRVENMVLAGKDRAGLSSGIFASSTSGADHSGDAGMITIRSKNAASASIHMQDESSLNTSSAGGGDAGNIEMEIGRLELSDGSSIFSASRLTSKKAGAAGTITIDSVDSVRLLGESSLSTEAMGAGGGRISVNAGNSVYLLNAEITSSVMQGEGKGGDVATHSKSVVLNQSNVTANAEKGDGGAIFIHADHFIRSSDSNVTATSKRGNEGSVRIEAPDIDISNGLTILPGNLLDAARWMKTPCAARSPENVSRFAITGWDAMPTSLDDLRASPAFAYPSVRETDDRQP